ncbi:MAG: hypothetical protein Q9227_006521 [Pyrenula ochraceoflavens]
MASSSATENPEHSTPPSSASAQNDPSPVDEDFWGSFQNSRAVTPSSDRQNELLSDAPLIRRQQTTAGYRQGISLGKAETMQSGFDEGYPAGIELGLRVGYLRGILEGIEVSEKRDSVNKEKTKERRLLEAVLEEVSIGKFIEGVEDILIKEAEKSAEIRDASVSTEQTSLHSQANMETQPDMRVRSDSQISPPLRFSQSAMDRLDFLEHAVSIAVSKVSAQHGSSSP